MIETKMRGANQIYSSSVKNHSLSSPTKGLDPQEIAEQPTTDEEWETRRNNRTIDKSTSINNLFGKNIDKQHPTTTSSMQNEHSTKSSQQAAVSSSSSKDNSD